MITDESMPWVIFDIDGTLADISHRLHYITKPDENGKKDWNNFNMEMHKDYLKKDVFGLYELCYDAGWNIAVVTGRFDTYQAMTIKWLMDHNIHYQQLHMRKAGDYRSDFEVKQDVYNEHLKHLPIMFVVDDRQQVVDMWRENGLTCLQCQKGDY